MEGATDYILYARNSPWDHSPGSLMVTESGGFVGHTDGTPYSPTVLTPGIIVAADRGTFTAVRRHAAEAFAKR
jgi:fructose-1,6-bisphosphatase/inositol monophosphatase family enzyme